MLQVPLWTVPDVSNGHLKAQHIKEDPHKEYMWSLNMM